MAQMAEQYVKLVLAMGEHDPAYVDAYFGPAQWREQAKVEKLSLARIRDQAVALQRDVQGAAEPSDAPVISLSNAVCCRNRHAFAKRR